MNRQEALEWAADYVVRYKFMEAHLAEMRPAEKLALVSELADSVVTPDEPRVITKYREPEPDCIAFIRKMSDKMAKNRTGVPARQKYQKAMSPCLDTIADDLVVTHTHQDPDENVGVGIVEDE